MLFTVEFFHSIVRSYLIEFLYVKLTFYVAFMLQDREKKATVTSSEFYLANHLIAENLYPYLIPRVLFPVAQKIRNSRTNLYNKACLYVIA